MQLQGSPPAPQSVSSSQSLAEPGSLGAAGDAFARGAIEVHAYAAGLPAVLGQHRAVGQPILVVLHAGRWPQWLRRLAGLTAPAVARRPAAVAEPGCLPNGHPYAWSYRSAVELLADEARAAAAAMGEESAKRYLQDLRQALKLAQWPDWTQPAASAAGATGATGATSAPAPAVPPQDAGVG